MFGSLAQSPWRSSICITPTGSSSLIGSRQRTVCPLLSARRGLEPNLQISWSRQEKRNSSHQLQHWVTVVNYSCGYWEQVQIAFSLETDAGCWDSGVPPLLHASHWMDLLSRNCAGRKDWDLTCTKKALILDPFSFFPDDFAHLDRGKGLWTMRLYTQTTRFSCQVHPCQLGDLEDTVTSPCLNFFTCKMKIIVISSSQLLGKF